MKKKLISLTVLAFLLIGIFGFTSPAQIGLPMYLLVFGFVYIFFALLILVIADLAYAKSPEKNRMFGSVVLAFSPTIILAISSLSSLTFVDFLLALGIPIVIVWYGLRGRVIK